MGLHLQIGRRNREPKPKTIYVKEQSNVMKYIFYAALIGLVYIFRKQILILLVSLF